MNDDRQDRRIRKTRSALRRCLSALLLKKPVKDISVRELTELADINRGTFYLHYHDVFDLLQNLEEEMFLKYTALLDRHDAEEVKESPRKLLVDLFHSGERGLNPHSDRFKRRSELSPATPLRLPGKDFGALVAVHCRQIRTGIRVLLFLYHGGRNRLNAPLGRERHGPFSRGNGNARGAFHCLRFLHPASARLDPQ